MPVSHICLQLAYGLKICVKEYHSCERITLALHWVCWLLEGKSFKSTDLRRDQPLRKHLGYLFALLETVFSLSSILMPPTWRSQAEDPRCLEGLTVHILT